MRIAYINNYPTGTGIGNYSLELYTRIRKSGINVDMYCVGEEGRNYEDAYILTNSKPPLRWLKSFQLPKLIPQDYDLYHILNQNLAFFLHKLEPAVITVHDAFFRLKYDSLMWRYILRKIFKYIPKANLIITNSHFTKTDLLLNLYIDESKVKVIYYGINHNIFRPMDKDKCRQRVQLPTDKSIILTVGGEKEKDNITTLIKSFYLLRKTLDDILLVIIGKPKSHVLRLIKDLSLNKKIIFFHSLTPYEMSILYNSADIFVFPSLYEGFGLPPVEAMACGIPVIASKITAIPEILGDAAVYLENPYDYVTLKKLIEEILKNEEIKEKMCSKGIRRAQKFTWEKTVMETIKVYKEVIE